jgi:hypothetical protein
MIYAVICHKCVGRFFHFLILWYRDPIQVYGSGRTAEMGIVLLPYPFPILTEGTAAGQAKHSSQPSVYSVIPHHIPSSAPSFGWRSVLRDNLFAGVLLDELDTLLDVLLEVTQAGLDELLLVGIDLANGVDLVNTLGAELDAAGEEINALVLVERGLDEGRLNDTLLALGGAEDGIGHAGTGESHGEGGRASTVLGLDNLVTTELDTVDELSVGAQIGVVALGEKRDDGDTGVTTNDGDVLVLGVGALDLGDEAAGTDDIEGGDTEEGLGVVDTGLLVDLAADGDGGVDGVGDDEELGLGGGLGSGFGEVTDDGGVGVEEIVTGHAGLAGDTSGDQDNLGALEGISEAGGSGVIALDAGGGVDVRDIGGDTC